MEPYRLPAYPDLVFGHYVVPKVDGDIDWTHVSPETFNPVPGVYKARDFVALMLPLLDSAIRRLGPDEHDDKPTARDILIKGLAAALATSGRESTLSIPYSDAGSAKAAVGRQAQRIAGTIIEFVRQMSDPVGNGDITLQIHSECERHVWTPEAACLLLGPRGDREIRQLYNEWLHRSILLRDALIPFENYEDVPLVIPRPGLDAPGSTPGIRAVEGQRSRFLLECRFGQQMSESAFVDLSKVFTAPRLPDGGFGLQYTQGLILPAWMSGPSSPPHLLRFYPATLDHTADNLLFEYENPRNEHTEQLDLSILARKRQSVRSVESFWQPSPYDAANVAVIQASISVTERRGSLRRVLKLELILNDGNRVSIDLGQIARGQKHAYRGTRRTIFEFDRVKILLQNPLSALKYRGVVTCHHNTSTAHPNLLHVFPPTVPLLRLALIGKIHSNNVVLLDEGQSIGQAIASGRSFGPMFVVYSKTVRG